MLFELSKHITLYIYHYYNIINRITNDFLIQKGLNNVSCYLNLFIAQLWLCIIWYIYYISCIVSSNNAYQGSN